MIHDQMSAGVESERLLVRLDPAWQETVRGKEGCHDMDFTEKVIKGFVDISALNTKRKPEYWIGRALEYTKTAKPSKKKTRK